jgi:hypothetical protein
MNNVVNRAHEMFVRVDAFASERAASFPANTLGGELVAELKGVIQSLTGAITSQATGLSSAQRATAERMAARETLRESMKAIARTARVMALDTPGLENKFRLPRSGSDSALLHTARAFAADALPLKAEFIRHELPPNFLEEFEADIADLERAMGGQNTGRDAHVSATATVESTAERGMNSVRKLDAIVRNKFRDDPATLAAWESARHVESASRARRRTNGAGGGTDSTGGKKD